MNLGLQYQALRYDLARKFGPVTVTDWYGIKMRLYPFEKTPIKKLITRENYRQEFEMYRKYARGVVFDVGANIGIHSVYLSRLATHVYAFEPVPQTFARLQETIALNGIKNITPVSVALGSRVENATIQLFDKEYSSWNSFYVPNAEKKPIKTIAVPVTTLDTYAERENISTIDFLKIDVEGHELEVLKGASRLLREKRIETVSFEVTHMHVKDPEEIFSLLRSHGYTLSAPDPTKVHQNYYATLT